MLLVGGELLGGLAEGAGRFRPGEEVDLHPTDAAGAELDVADTASRRRLAGCSPPRMLAITEAATTRAAPSANTPAFGTPAVVTSPTAYTPGNLVSSVLELTGT